MYISTESGKRYQKSVDVLNECFGKNYRGWRRGGYNHADKRYMVWFPKISINGKTASSSGWINTIEKNGTIIREARPDDGCVNEYVLDDRLRLVFAKMPDEPYAFVGVFKPLYDEITARENVFVKVADAAYVSNTEVKIACYI